MKAAIQILFLGLVLVLASCGGKGEADDSSKQKELDELLSQRADLDNQIRLLKDDMNINDPEREDKVTKVKVLEVLASDYVHSIPIQGRTESDAIVQVSPEMPGRLTSIKVKEGQRVGGGQTIATVDATSLQKGLAEVQTQLNLAKTVYEKRSRLWSQGIGSEIEYLNSKTNVESLQAKMATIESQVAMSRVKSPISGTVEKVYAKRGEMGSPGVPIVQIVNTRQLKVVADVSEDFAASVKRGGKLQVELPGETKPISTRVSRVGQTINPDNRTFLMEAKISNSRGTIKPNMMATISMVDYEKRKAIVVPTKAILFEDKTYVFVAKEVSDEKLGDIVKVTKTEVEIEKNFGGESVIASGLAPGDKLVTEGIRKLQDDLEVIVID